MLRVCSQAGARKHRLRTFTEDASCGNLQTNITTALQELEATERAPVHQRY